MSNRLLSVLTVSAGLLQFAATGRAAVTLPDPVTPEGFVSLLLINEVPFPGEGRYISVADSKAGMLQILWVLHHRVTPPPRGYLLQHISTVRSTNMIDVIGAGGVRGQVDGFYRDADGTPATTPRVKERLNHLLRIANSGPPGKFAELISYAKHLGVAYFKSGPDGLDYYAELRRIGSVSVTGGAYSWMTDEARFAPGGNYVRIPDASRGGLGGNRFFTLRKLQ